MSSNIIGLGSQYMITTITTTTTIAATAATALGAMGTMLLIILLIAKELSDSHDNDKLQKLGRNSMLVIAPLLFAFAAIVCVKIIDVL